MATPITFTQIDSVPDILPANRHKLIFPSMGGNASGLTLRYVSVQLPTEGIAQITIPYLGHPISFRGGTTSEHTVTVEFNEDSAGTTLNTLYAWMGLVRSHKQGQGGYKKEYAKDGELHVFDTTGVPTHKFTLLNMWPFNITLPQNGQDSAAYQVSVQFSVDGVDLTTSTEYEPATGNDAVNNVYGNPYSEVGSGITDSVLNMSNGTVLGAGTSGSSLGLSGGISLSSSGATISLGTFSLKFGSLFKF